MFFSIEQLTWCTGFPPETLRDFAKRGLLPKSNSGDPEGTMFNGLALVQQLEVLRNAQ